ncbi:MAG: hypothetical protein KDC44_15960 [Phaeodactylibacter sp.]|nr:hypothetical protein [Phaeodactylibacter sp.]
MEVKFDNNGYLLPYERLRIDLKTFKEQFVDQFDKGSSRHLLYRQYVEYTMLFQSKVAENFTQWINGSYVTDTENPSDIDLVNLVDYKSVQGKEELVQREFMTTGASKKFGIDAYLLILYPEGHKFNSWTKSDLFYWNDWFTKSKMNRSRKRHPKGYLEIVWGKA